MKITIATCFESNEERMKLLNDAFISRGYTVYAITSDFSHIRKEKRKYNPYGFTMISTKPYKKNLSLQRMLSHREFAKETFMLMEKQDPDLIWLMAPANSLIKEAKCFMERHPDKKLIIDIIDMWPESLPIKINKDIIPLSWWRNIRRHNINCCDRLVTECDLYQEILKYEYHGKIQTIRWAREGKADRIRPSLDTKKLSLVYIGSINNIIDTDKIASIIRSISMPVILHVIGEGENTERFLKVTSDICETVYHGPIRDEKKKAEIFKECHVGINIYKEDLYIGLTVKCIDYFKHGLPIINNIKGDTWDLVERYKAGVNYTDELNLDGQGLINMRLNNQGIYDLYDENFSKEVFTEDCLQAVDEVMK